MSYPSESETRAAFPMRDVLTVVFKRRRLIIAFFLLAVTSVAVWTFTIPPEYEVTASILVKKARAEVAIAGTYNQVTQEDLNSEIEILKSRELIEGVLRSLDIEARTRPETFYSRIKSKVKDVLGSVPLSHFDAMVLELQRELNVEPVRKSNILQVLYRSQDPIWATEVVQMLTEQYMERRSEVYEPVETAAFFEEQLETAKGRLATAEESLGEFLVKEDLTMMGAPQGIDGLAAQKEVALRQLAELESGLVEAQAAMKENEEKIQSLEARLAVEPERLKSANRLNLDPAVEEIERNLINLRLERDRLIQNYTSDNRQVKDIDAQITLAEKRLEEANRRFERIDRTEINPAYQELKTQLVHTTTDYEGARARFSALSRQSEHFRRVLDELNEKSLALDKLHREARSTEETYLLYRKKYEEARISAAMDQQKLVNVTIAQPARKPIEPVAPKKTFNLAVSIFLGIVGGLGLAFVLEYFDHTFTSSLDIEKRLGVPHLASIEEGGVAGPVKGVLGLGESG